jgi:filamentous hemagglutinin family protein
MNRNYRHVWSYVTQSWQVAPETARRSGKGGGTRRAALAVVGALSIVALGGIASLSHAQQAPPSTQLPTGANVVRGAASIVQSGATLNVSQTTQNAVVNWSTFNVGANAQVNFNQPNSTSTTLNRVTDANPSQIFGKINSNGHVFLANPSGVYFAPSAQVDVGALTATTHTITDDNFMAGKYQFVRNGATGKVVNEGKLTAAMGGYIALLAPEVQNAGVVIAKAGTVAMAAGELITLTFSERNSLAGISTTPSTIASLIENKLAVQVPDGQIILSAVAMNKLQAGVVKNSGSLEASSLVSKGGKIVLEGDEITLATNSKIDASGTTGGGTVLVGGDWQGGGTVRQATKVTMEAGSHIDASATDLGDGGKVVLWSDLSNGSARTVVSGAISAHGGALWGQGGRVETSGHNLQLNGQVQPGSNGTWLIDPVDLTVDVSTASAINTALEANTSVSVQAGASASCTVSCPTTVPGVGNLYVNAPLTWTTNASLTLSASNNIYIAAPITSSGTNASLNLFYGGSNLSTAPSNGTYYRLDMTNPGTNYVSMTGGGAQLMIGNQSYTLLQSIADIQAMNASGGYYALGQSLNTPSTYTNAVYTGNFQGAFDGLGNTVSGIRLINSCTSNCNIGFFAQASNGAKIRNLLLNEIFTLTGPSSGSATYSNYAVGGLVGRVTGGTSAAPNTFSGNGITFVQNTSNVSTLSISGYWGGGIIGQTFGASPVYAQISNNFASLNVNNTSVLSINSSSIGGIVGDASASTSGATGGSGGQINISSTYVSGSIQVKQAGYWGVGGLIGQAYGTPVVANNSYTYFEPGSLTSTSGTVSVGGLMGWATSLTLTNSYSTYGSNSSSNASTHVYYGTSLTGNNSLLTGLDSSYWQLSGGAIVLKNLPVPSPAPGVPIYVYETVTSGVYGNLTFSYSLYDSSLSPIVPGAGTYANLSVTGAASYNLNNSTDAGTYSIKYASGLILGGSAAPSYSLYAYPNTYTIQKAPLQVTVNNDAKAQGQGDAVGYAGVSYSGFANGQTSAVLGGNLSIARSASAPDGSTVINGSPNSESIGTFTGALTATGLSSKNYDFTYVAGNYQILPANQLVVRIANQTASYGANPSYALSSVRYFDSALQSTVDVTSSAMLSGNVVTVTDGNGGIEQFLLTPQSPNTSSTSHTLQTGVYQLTASGISNNSTFGSPTVIGSLTVTPTAITPSLAQAPSKSYDGLRALNFNNLSFSLAGLVANDVVSITGTGAFSSKSVGSGNVSYSLSGLGLNGADAANYYLSSANTTMTGSNGSITPALLGVSVQAKYAGSTTVTPTSYSLTGLQGDDSAATLSSVVINNQNVTSANLVNSLVLSNGSQGNYVLNSSINTALGTNTTNTVTLSQAPLGISVAAVYSGATLVTPTSMTMTGLVGSDAGAIASNITLNSKDVATANRISSLTLSTGSESNYLLNSLANASLNSNTTNTVTLSKKSLNLTGLTVTPNKVYDGTTTANLSGTPALLASESVGTGSSSDGAPYSSDAVALSVSSLAGNYNASTVNGANAITLSGITLNSTNYKLQTYSGSITRAPLGISANAVYANSTTVTPTQATLYGLVASDASATVTSMVVNNQNVASANSASSVVLSNGAQGNYQLNVMPNATLGSNTTNSVSLTAKGLSITGAAVTSKEYDGTASATLIGTLSGVIAADSSAVNLSTLTGTFAAADVGSAISVTPSYAISGAKASNYSLTQPLGMTGSITAKALTIFSPLVTAKFYDGTTSADLTGTLSGVIAADNAYVSLSALSGTFASANAATAISVTPSYAISGTKAANYSLVQPTGMSGTINKASLTLSTADVVKVYDGTTSVTGATTAPSLVVSSGTLYANASNGGVMDSISGGTFGFTDANAGTNNKTVSVGGVTVNDGNAGGNYALSYVPNTHSTIEKAPLTLSTADVVKVYDGTTSVTGATTAPSLVVSSGTLYANASNGGVMDSISGGTFTFSDANAGINNKTVSVSGVTVSDSNPSGNYALSYVPNTHSTIDKASLTVTGSTSTVIYNGLNQVNTYQVTGFQGTDTATSTGLNVAGSAAATNVGTYADILSVAALNNYNVNTVNSSLTINPLPVSLSGAKNYDGTALLNTSATGSTLKVSNAVANSTVNVVGQATLASAASGNQGVVDFNALTLDNANYTLIGASGTVKVVDTSLINVQPLTLVETSSLIGGSQLKGLTAAQIGLFSNVQLQVFTPEILDALSSTQIAGLTADQLNGLSQTQISGIAPSQVALLTTAQIESLSPTQFANLTPQQLQVMTLAQISVLTEPQLSAMSPQQIAALSWQQLAAMTPKQLALIGKTPTENDSATQMGKLESTVTVANLRHMSGLQVRQLKNDQISSLTPEQIKALGPAQLQALTTQQLSALSPTQVVALTPSQLAVMSKHQTKTLDSVVVELPESSADTPPVTSEEPASASTEERLPERDSPTSKFVLDQIANTGSMDSLPEVFTSLSVHSASGMLVTFEAGLLNNKLVIVVQDEHAKEMVRDELERVLTAALDALNSLTDDGPDILLEHLAGLMFDFRETHPHRHLVV